MSPVCRRFWVSGRVQGVFFRVSTARVAQRLDLTGYAKNLTDGRVEVLACGGPDEVARLEAWLHEGPPASAVTLVSSENADIEAPSAFSTG